MASPLQKEFDYYLAHQDKLVAKYEGKVLVIRDAKVVGVYDSEVEAISEASKTYPLGTFLVQRCEAGEDSVTQTYHSRVGIA